MGVIGPPRGGDLERCSPLSDKQNIGEELVTPNHGELNTYVVRTYSPEISNDCTDLRISRRGESHPFGKLPIDVVASINS